MEEERGTPLPHLNKKIKQRFCLSSLNHSFGESSLSKEKRIQSHSGKILKNVAKIIIRSNDSKTLKNLLKLNE